MKIYKCGDCGRYTLETTCPKCGALTMDPRPARYSPLDPYGIYRRLAKKGA